MKNNILTYLFLFLGFIIFQNINAQIEQEIEPQDSVIPVNNNKDFQPKFFKALSERGIENYKKAAEILETLKAEHSDKAVVFFQLGLNYFDLEQYNLALEHLQKADELKPNDFDIREALFRVYYQQKNYAKALELASDLALKKSEYYEILANLYLTTEQYKKALEALEKADQKQGFDAHKDQLREVIFEAYDKQKFAISYYQKRIELEPYNPLNAYRLTRFLMQENQYHEALKVLENLIENHPRFTRAYVLKTQVYLKLDQVEQAFDALEAVVSDRFLEENYKVQAIEYIKSFVEKNPEYQDKFVQVLNVASETAENSASFLDLGLFYFENDKPRALENFKKALSQNPQDFQILRYVGVLELQLNRPQATIETAEKALEIYPTQAVFMLIKGQALLELTQYNFAETVLLEAESYIFEENDMMLKLYETLQKVYVGLNNEAQSKLYQSKAEELKNK
ncbi:tetratricopeptide repeat protein [Flavobacterium sp. CS20]|uniref:tetratricopeptide repeat protein n=1 Tax=Flavobacterium sp. CS20 TaxID=2775246 RepID=UPI001B3A04FF|nr:tetratricopeptide repeat protein [Flavobacterium sp. CS20]QTY26859.1 tetratricopeptide repeat protein [Flavobacterium sp. CS20]